MYAAAMDLPECGIYRTTVAIGGVLAGRLVYFHNHGDPGPGVYLPAKWIQNRAQWQPSGTTLPDDISPSTLEPLLPEGLYRVLDGFHCCAKECAWYGDEMLVQLGYNGAAEPIIFVPEWTDAGFAIPEVGHKAEPAQLARLAVLDVRGGKRPREPQVDKLLN